MVNLVWFSPKWRMLTELESDVFYFFWVSLTSPKAPFPMTLIVMKSVRVSRVRLNLRKSDSFRPRA